MARGPDTAPAEGSAPLCLGVGEAGHPVGAGRRSRKGREAAPGLQGHCKDSWMYPVFPSTTAGSFGPGYRRGLRPRFATCGLLPQTPSLRLAYSQRPRHRVGRRPGTTLGFSYNHPRCAGRTTKAPGTAPAAGPAPLLALVPGAQLQRCVQVGDQVAVVFDPHRQPQHAFADADALFLLGGQ